MNKAIAELVVEENISITEAMRRLDKTGRGILFLCQGTTLRATLTDGDIRRYILTGGDLSAPVSVVANYQYIAISRKEEAQAKQRIRENQIKALPVVSERNTLLAVHFWDDTFLSNKSELNIPVVIQAGGKGTRLYPYTKILPKPLIPIGDTTITEMIIDRFSQYGCHDFTMIVNHKKNMIKAYFSEERPQDQIRFIEENMPLGTGGGLSLLKGAVKETFFLTNCDILIYEDYEKIYSHHKQGGYIISIVCALKELSLAYGTVELGTEGQVQGFSEKPSFSFLTNTGLYIIEPRFLQTIATDHFVHITDLIQTCIDRGEKVGVFPVSEGQWADMGQPDALEAFYRREGIQL